jgi:large subunit ribosomal protein L14e
MNMNLGDVVISKAGRDKSRYFIIIEKADENYVYIVDGDLRRTDKPKKKKVKHLQVVKKFDSSSSELQVIREKIKNFQKVTNAEIRKCLQNLACDND